jgi:hypothetical protein
MPALWPILARLAALQAMFPSPSPILARLAVLRVILPVQSVRPA